MEVLVTYYLFSMIYLIVKTKKAMHMLQQNLYNENNRYVKWILKNKKTAFMHLDFISVLLLIINTYKPNIILIIVSILLMIINGYLIRKREKKEQVKKPLVITARVKRLIVTTTILYLLPLLIMINNNIELTILVLTIMIYFNYIGII